MQLVFASENNGFLKALEKEFKHTFCNVGLTCPLVMQKTPNYLMSFLPGPLIHISCNNNLPTPHIFSLGNGYYHIQAPATQLSFALMELVEKFDSHLINYVIVGAFGPIHSYSQRQQTAQLMHNAFLATFT